MPAYHVIITLKSQPDKPIINDNMLANELSFRNIVESYNNGEDFRFGDEIISYADVLNIKIMESEKPFIPSLFGFPSQKNFADRWQEINRMPNVTSKFIKMLPNKKEEYKTLNKNVFIVHGKDEKTKLELARMLEKLGFNAIILSEQPDKGRTIIEKFEEETMDIGYAFVILTPDDWGGTKDDFLSILDGMTRGYTDLEDAFHDKELQYRARQNVILELGYFVGKIGRKRVCCLYKGDVELPSDIHGVLFKKFDKSIEECYRKILEDLKAAGYEIKF